MAGPAFFSSGMNIAKNYDWIVAFKLQDTAEEAVDLTDSILRLMIKKHDTDNEALVSVSSEDINPEDNGGIIITSAIDGEFTVIILRKQLQRLYSGEYVADLVRRTPDDKQQRLWDVSPVTVVEGITP